MQIYTYKRARETDLDEGPEIREKARGCCIRGIFRQISPSRDDGWVEKMIGVKV